MNIESRDLDLGGTLNRVEGVATFACDLFHSVFSTSTFRKFIIFNSTTTEATFVISQVRKEIKFFDSRIKREEIGGNRRRISKAGLCGKAHKG